jgi:tRNA pseudouridine38-40 synthase
LVKLQECLNVFIGTHDFRSFCTGTTEELKSGTIRKIDEIAIEYSEQLGAHRIVVKGQKFLHHMIRRIVGACIEVASRDDLNINVLHAALAVKNPSQILPNAPAKGLLLYNIQYQEETQ